MTQPSATSTQEILESQVIRIKRGRMNKFGFEPAWNSYFDFYLSAKYLEKPILQLEDVAFHLFLRKNLNDGDPNWQMPSYKQIKTRFGIGQNKIEAMMGRLERAHLLEKVSGRRRGEKQSNVTNEYVLSDPIQDKEQFLAVAAASEFLELTAKGELRPVLPKAMWLTPATPPIPKMGIAPIPETGIAPIPKMGRQQHTSLKQTSKEQQHGAASNNSADVVVALFKMGISKRSAEQLARQHPADYIREKIELVEYLSDSHSPLVTKNPAGYLRKAIEEDYQPPQKFKSRQQREAEEQAEQEAQAQRVQERRRAHEAWRAQVLATHPVDERLLAQWETLLAQVVPEAFTPLLGAWLKRSLLIAQDNGTAVVAVPDDYGSRTLTDSLAEKIGQALGRESGYPIEVRFEVIRPVETE